MEDHVTGAISTDEPGIEKVPPEQWVGAEPLWCDQQLEQHPQLGIRPARCAVDRHC